MLQSFLTVGQQILTLYLLLVVGFVLGKVKLLDDRASVALSSLVMYVVSPCMMVWRSSGRWSIRHCTTSA